MPAEPFEMMLALNPRVDHKSRVSVRQCFYSVPARFVGRRIDVYLGAEHVEAREQGRVVARHERAVGKGTEQLCLDHYLEVLDYKPGALAGATASGPLGPRVRSPTSTNASGPPPDESWATRPGPGFDRGAVGPSPRGSPGALQGMERALSSGSVDPAVVLVEARRSGEGGRSVPLPIGSLHLFDRPMPVLSPYDELLEANS